MHSLNFEIRSRENAKFDFGVALCAALLIIQRAC